MLQNNFTIGLTNNYPLNYTPIAMPYTLCGQWNGIAPAAHTLFVQCVSNWPPAKFQYVSIIGQFHQLNFCEVQVYAAGKIDKSVSR